MQQIFQQQDDGTAEPVVDDVQAEDEMRAAARAKNAHAAAAMRANAPLVGTDEEKLMASAARQANGADDA